MKMCVEFIFTKKNKLHIYVFDYLWMVAMNGVEMSGGGGKAPLWLYTFVYFWLGKPGYCFPYFKI